MTTCSVWDGISTDPLTLLTQYDTDNNCNNYRWLLWMFFSATQGTHLLDVTSNITNMESFEIQEHSNEHAIHRMEYTVEYTRKLCNSRVTSKAHASYKRLSHSSQRVNTLTITTVKVILKCVYITNHTQRLILFINMNVQSSRLAPTEI